MLYVLINYIYKTFCPEIRYIPTQLSFKSDSTNSNQHSSAEKKKKLFIDQLTFMSTKQFDEAVGFLEDFHVNWSKSEAVPIPDTLAHAVDALVVATPSYTIFTSQFDWLGLDPRTLIGNYTKPSRFR